MTHGLQNIQIIYYIKHVMYMLCQEYETAQIINWAGIGHVHDNDRNLVYFEITCSYSKYICQQYQ